MKQRHMFTVLFFFLAQNSVFAQTSDSGAEMGIKITLTFLIISVAVLLYIIGALDGNVEVFTGMFRRITKYIIPTKEETLNAKDLGHDFDGIRELNNRIPPWFNYLFLGTVIFGIIYLIDYHVVKVSPLMYDEYQQEVETANLQRQILMASEPPIDEANLTPLKDSVSISQGKEIYKKYCISCHGDNGQGIVGPNLTDQYWIHGGGVKNIFATIKNGVPSKGMISWQLVLTGKQIQETSSYILTLHGTNPPGAKAPQGDLWVEPAVAAVDSTQKAKM